MGSMRHHAIVVTGWEEQIVEKAQGKAVKLGCLVSGVFRSPINDWYSFCVFPDGSKEGWEDSDHGDSARDKLIKRLRKTNLDWVEVQYGDDCGDTHVCRHSDEERWPAKEED